MGKPRAKPRQKVVAKGTSPRSLRAAQRQANAQQACTLPTGSNARLGAVQARREPQPHGSQEQRHTTVAAGVAAPHRQDERQAEESAEEAEAAAAASKTRRKGEALEEGDAVAATPLTATQEAREMTQAPTVDAEPAQGEAAAGAATSANGSVSLLPLSTTQHVRVPESSSWRGAIGSAEGVGMGAGGAVHRGTTAAMRVAFTVEPAFSQRRGDSEQRWHLPTGPLRGWHQQGQTPQEPKLQPHCRPKKE
ncbi:unnamed protein product [Closterium sp. NIES-65]|nr:unnamed protein product [Closterium sp. NIES-65]